MTWRDSLAEAEGDLWVLWLVACALFAVWWAGLTARARWWPRKGGSR